MSRSQAKRSPSKPTRMWLRHRVACTMTIFSNMASPLRDEQTISELPDSKRTVMRRRHVCGVIGRSRKLVTDTTCDFLYGFERRRTRFEHAKPNRDDAVA